MSAKFENETYFEFGEGFNQGYTLLPNNILNDKRLSFKALGIYAQIVQFQNSREHRVYMKSLQKLKTDRESSVRSGVKELIDNGYIERIAIRNELGHMKGYRYIVHVKPIENTTIEPKRENPVSVNPVSDNLAHINKIGLKENKKKENKEVEEDEKKSTKLLQMYYEEYKLSAKKMPHIKKLVEKYSDKFDIDLWEEIFISACEDNVTSKYKYVRTVLEDLESRNIFTLEVYKKEKADLKKPTNKNNSDNSISQKPKKDTNNYKKENNSNRAYYDNSNMVVDGMNFEDIDGDLFDEIVERRNRERFDM